ncbi:MAG: peptidoglycan-binding domain-containing protein [Candidatus Accumulibacter sp. UW26]|jgi:murein L,D-transpeptidase YcbB/YkuD|uniref:Peptidoglycan-binding protein n=2 Tax=Candidatus Accumulibacter TaxID=327159 RepID=A0ABX1TH10_9PROT|nr:MULTISPECIES: peptidoglycan-binding domain-containing protein [Candidatus Accumulibacter]KFB71055.1 MAG: putative peptidoglycan binding domain protein [Candidatus Accumulibacter phosphatis]MBL8408100.1 peptidoglycan-binding protein [Accumulibacter sp.]NMQ07653.1 peptidoglycan-binding protein [Candidatus Accumulibacter contiguus]HRF10620.1 peptidoglycan-binding domain-containing protein [Candidatus Accumulibacter phosphatis]
MSEAIPSQAPAAEPQDNPFATVAQLLRSLRESLEGTKRPGQAPRWVRIARIRAYRGDTDFISKAVIPAVDKALAFTVLYLASLTLQARDLLQQADSAKALVETSGEMLQVVTTEEFTQALAEAVDQKGVVNPLREARGVIDNVTTFVDKVPDPADLDLISKELYGLLCLEQLPLDEAGLDATTEVHLNLETSGKIRLLQMALNNPVRIRGLGKSKQGEQELAFLGTRRIWPAAAADLPGKAIGRWGTELDSETIYEFDFTRPGVAGQDIAEANGLLEKLGYVEPAVTDAKVFDDTLQRRLRRFQKINGLAITGQLDNPTLNGLQHLNHASKSLKRAQSFDADALKDFDDTKNET